MSFVSSNLRGAPTGARPGTLRTALRHAAVALTAVALAVTGGTTAMADVDVADPSTPAPTPTSTAAPATVTPEPDRTPSATAPAAEPPSATPSPSGTTSPLHTTATESPSAQQRPVAPLAVGQPDGNPPYIHWTARTSSQQPVSGLTFDVKIENCFLFFCSWDIVATVQDCVATDASQCTGRDRDPDAGEFTVERVLSGRTYQLTQASTPYWFNGSWYSPQSTTNITNSWSNRVATFGNRTQVAANTVTATVNVNLADVRTGLTDTGLTAAHSAGARFGLYPTSDATAPISTCQVPAGSTQCRFTVSVPDGTALWVGPLDPVPGSDAAQHLSEPITTLTTGTSGGFTDRAYRFQTPALRNDTSVTIPGTATSGTGWNATSTRLVHRLRNPELALSCSAGIKVALVMDLSGSIATSRAQDTLRDAALGLVEDLRGTGSSMALFSFGDTSPRAGTANLPALRALDDATQRDALVTQIHNYRTHTVTDQGTNWDAGLLAASAQAQDYDVVLVLTDGNPTFSNTGSRSTASHGSGSLTAFRELERAVLSANAIKAKGARVVAVGVGGDLSRHNLAAISGPRGYEPGLSLNDVDHTTAGWEQLGTLLKQFARGLSCQADVVVEKRTGDTVATAAPAGGWTFSSDLAPRTPQTTETSGPAVGTTSWTVSFDDPGDEKSVTLTELSTDAAWHLAELTCTVNGRPHQVTVAQSVTIPGVGVGDTVRCVFTSIRTSSVQVDKQWVINGTTHAHGEQPTGYGAELTLTGPATAGPSAQQWATARTGYRAGDQVVITETTELPAHLRGCVLESSLIRPAGATGPGADVAGGHTATLTAGVNAWTVTNTVTCTTLTLTKEFEHAWGGTSEVSDWVLTSSPGGDAVVHPSGEPVGVEPGEHVLAEALRPGREHLADGYDLTHVSCAADGRTLLDGAPATVGLTVTVPAGTDTVCVLTNTDKPGSVQWAKVDEMQRPLAGSVWQLRGPGGDVVEVTDRDERSSTGPDAAGPGQFLVQDLVWGRYTLTETRAPSGFRLAEGSVEFTIGPDADGMVVVFTEPFVNVPYPAVVLPLTGGTARDLFTVAGTALMAAALLASLALRRRTLTSTNA